MIKISCIINFLGCIKCIWINESGLPFCWVTNSGYMQRIWFNLISFYRAINPNIPYIQIFQPVSKELAFQIWDKYGAVGNNKNYTSWHSSLSAASSTRKTNTWYFTSWVEHNKTSEVWIAFYESEMNVRILKLGLFLLAVVFIFVIYAVFVSFSEHQNT